jgi:hypothetical protein
MKKMIVLLLPVVASLVVLIETAMVFAVIYLIHRLFRIKRSLAFGAFALLSFPGVLVAAGGFSGGFAFPLPLGLGLPLQLMIFIHKFGGGGWLPPPLATLVIIFNVAKADDVAFIFIIFLSELAMLLTWYLSVRKVYKRACASLFTEEEKIKINTLIMPLRSKGYQFKGRLYGWLIIEPQGVRRKVKSLSELEAFIRTTE